MFFQFIQSSSSSKKLEYINFLYILIIFFRDANSENFFHSSFCHCIFSCFPSEWKYFGQNYNSPLSVNTLFLSSNRAAVKFCVHSKTPGSRICGNRGHSYYSVRQVSTSMISSSDGSCVTNSTVLPSHRRRVSSITRRLVF